MLKALKQEFNIRKCELIPYLGMCLTTWAVGVILSYVLFNSMGANKYANLGLLLLLILGSMTYVLTVIGGYSISYNTAISMNKPRKLFMASHAVIALLHNLVYTIMVYGFFLFERFLAGVFFPKLIQSEQFIFVNFKFLAIVFGALALIYVVGVFISTMIMQFGKKAFWVLWGIYMFVVLFGTAFLNRVKSIDSNTIIGRFMIGIRNFFGTITLNEAIILTLVAVAAMLTYSILYLRKAALKN